MGEVDCIRSVGIDANVFGFSDVPTGHYAPALASIESSEGAIQGRCVKDVAVTRVEGNGENARVVDSYVLPIAGFIAALEAAGGHNLRSDDVVFVNRRAHVEIVFRSLR